MADWRDRLSPVISLVSPGGNVFEAFWQNNPRSLAKKLGIFEFPGVKGAVVQDLDVGATVWPLTIFFSGADNDKDGSRFFEACKERGLWSVVHPVKGALSLQLTRATEQVSPVDSGNITRFETEWIEPIDTVNLPSTSQLRATVLDQVNDLNETSSDQLGQIAQLATAEETTAFESAVNSVVTSVDTFLKPIYEQNATINAQVNSIKRGIDALISEPVLDVISIAGQVQALVQLPSIAITDVTERISAYRGMIDGILGISPDEPSGRNLNVIGIHELAMVSVMGAVASIGVTGSLTSRAESIELIDSISGFFADITTGLDAVQEIYESNPIEIQYISQLQSFSDGALITARALAFLLRTIFDLSVEKRFVLSKDRTPIEITIAEYGTPGEDDINFDLFIQSNGLNGNEILVLPAGREVVIYI